MKFKLSVGLIALILSSCTLKLKTTEVNKVNGTLIAHVNDTINLNEEKLVKSPKKVLLILKDDFISVMPLDELEAFMNQTKKSFTNENNTMELSKSHSLKISSKNNEIDLTKHNLNGYDYILVLDSLVDNLNYRITTYKDSLGKTQQIPNICYPNSSICNNESEFEKWAENKDIKIEPFQNTQTENLNIELIYGYTRTLVYSGNDGKLIGELNMFLSDFDLVNELPFKFTSTLETYNKPFRKESLGTDVFKLRKINQKLFVQLDPTGVYGLFEFGKLFGEKLLNNLKN